MEQVISATVVQGYGVASGKASDSPYSDGSVKLQAPVFKKLGLDLSDCFLGTINLDISPMQFEIIQADYRFKDVDWYPQVTEDFSFVCCKVHYQEHSYQGWIYYPHPETKTAHIHSQSVVEVISPFIDSLNYQDKVELTVDATKIKLY